MPLGRRPEIFSGWLLTGDPKQQLQCRLPGNGVVAVPFSAFHADPQAIAAGHIRHTEAMNLQEDAADFRLQTLDSVELRLPLAGIGARSYAFVIDWHIRLLAALMWFGLAYAVLKHLPYDREQAMVFGEMLPTTFIYLAYHPVLEVLQRGLTPGKRIAGIRIVAQDGGTAGVGALLLRNLFRLIDSLPAFYGLGLLVMTVSTRPLRFGDVASGTLVVYDSKPDHKAVKTETLLADHNINPQWILLADELLRRWNELEAEQRDVLARRLLQRAGREADSLSANPRLCLERLRAGKP
jgi:uncharacterized RDD family membrane protein YckC